MTVTTTQVQCLTASLWLDAEDKAIGVWGMPWNKIITKNHLHLVAKNLNLRNCGSKSKDVLIANVIQACNTNNKGKDVKKSRDCPFRFLNMLFLDDGVDVSIDLGDPAMQSKADTGVPHLATTTQRLESIRCHQAQCLDRGSS